MNKLSRLFDQIYIKNKSKIAIQIGEKKYSYSDINILSDKFFFYYESKIKKKNTLILIEGEKNIYTYCAILGAIKSSYAYSVLDPKTTKKRLLNILEKKSNYLLIKNNKNIYKNLNKKEVRQTTFQEIFERNIVTKKNTFREKKTVYVIFTSGSTGKPKGCMIDEDNIISFIKIWKKYFNLGKKSFNFSQLNPLYFDNSIFDFYISLFNGSSLTVIDTSSTKSLFAVPDLIKRYKCDISFAVPSLIIFLLNFRIIKKKHFKDLKYLIFGGEGFPKKHLKDLWKIKNKGLINVYGPSECTCICSKHKVMKKDIFFEKEKFVSLGKITDNFTYKIDKTNQELLLFGEGVGQGYLNNKKLTQKNFIYKKNKILGYKTGDIVKVINKKIYFIGRVDNQVKVMGYRVELEEIEKQMINIKYVKECVVIFKSSNNELISYVHSQNKISSNKIIEELNKILPYYMIPKTINILRKPLKKNRNYKIDRKYYNLINV